MNYLLITILNKICWFFDITGQSSVQELELTVEAYEELKKFAKWKDESSASLKNSPSFDWNDVPILPDVENFKFPINGYIFNIIIKK